METSLFWPGTTIGDADTWTRQGGYTAAADGQTGPWTDLFWRAVLNGTGNRGVLYGWRNNLAVTGVVTPVQVDTGGAVVYGLFYENDAALNVAIATPNYDTRQDRIVLRRDWTAQTARVTLLTGLEGGGLPALTQSPDPGGSGIYDIPLAALSTTTGGAITVTDEREYCTFSTVVPAASIASGQIAADIIGWEQRATRSKNIMFGAGDLWPLASGFSYNNLGWGIWGSVAAAWGAAAATG
ncbi:MAG: hypothetical protein KKH61_19820, partial [Gammaproteobacteria bacterium]|nr:hypothetical protein [Gammaproteobacteria bacterium]